MAVKHIVTRGIGLSPGSVKFIVTHGFNIGTSADFALFYVVEARVKRTLVIEALAQPGVTDQRFGAGLFGAGPFGAQSVRSSGKTIEAKTNRTLTIEGEA